MTTIKLKNGSGAPTAGDLVQGEPALDLTNKRLYTEDSGGTVIEVGTNPGVDVTFADDRKAIFGTGSDLQIYHNGNHSFIEDSGTGNLYIRGTNLEIQSTAQEKYLAANANGGVKLYYDNAEKLATTSTGIDVTGVITTDGMTTSADINFGDNDKAVFGAGSDLEIYHESSTGRSFIKETGADEFRILGSNIRIKNGGDSKTYMQMTDGGSVAIRHNDGTKLETTSTGIDVTGTVTADGLTIDASTSGMITLNHSTPSNLTTIGQDSSGDFRIRSDSVNRLKSYANGDFELYEDTGTTAKFFWDSSAEKLEIGSIQGAASGFLAVKSNTDHHGIAIEENSGSENWNLGVNAAGDLGFYNSGDTTASVVIDDSNNVGIGTTSPSALGHLYKSGAESKLLVEGDGAGASAKVAIDGHTTAQLDLTYRSNTSSKTASLIHQTNGDLAINTLSAERMRIDSSGNVGIGTTSPQAYLHVYGTSAETLRLQGNDEFTYLSFRGTVGTEQRLGYLGFANDTGTAADLNLTNEQAGAISFSANGSERMRIDSSGNVGINQSSPSKKLHVTSAGSGTVAVFGDSANNNTVEVTRTTTNASYIGLSATSAVGGIVAGPTFKFSTCDSSGSSATERMRIDSSGNLLVGGTSIGAENSTSIASTGDMTISRASGATRTMISFKNGGSAVGSVVTSTTATTYNTSSDQRLKDNIVDAPSASDDIDAIQVRSFDWKADGSHQKYGMVAQELQSVAPEAVTGDADSEDMMGVDYSKLVPMMMKEIQSLRARVAQLEGEN